MTSWLSAFLLSWLSAFLFIWLALYLDGWLFGSLYDKLAGKLGQAKSHNADRAGSIGIPGNVVGHDRLTRQETKAGDNLAK